MLLSVPERKDRRDRKTLASSTSEAELLETGRGWRTTQLLLHLSAPSWSVTEIGSSGYFGFLSSWSYDGFEWLVYKRDMFNLYKINPLSFGHIATLDPS